MMLPVQQTKVGQAFLPCVCVLEANRGYPTTSSYVSRRSSWLSSMRQECHLSANEFITERPDLHSLVVSAATELIGACCEPGRAACTSESGLPTTCGAVQSWEGMSP